MFTYRRSQNILYNSNRMRGLDRDPVNLNPDSQFWTIQGGVPGQAREGHLSRLRQGHHPPSQRIYRTLPFKWIVILYLYL